jgi:hypothetical protein
MDGFLQEPSPDGFSDSRMKQRGMSTLPVGASQRCFQLFLMFDW